MSIRSYILGLSCILFAQQTLVSFPKKSQNVASQQTVHQKIQECRQYLSNHAAHDPIVLKVYDELISEWLSYCKTQQGDFDIQSLLDGIDFAAAKHEGQYREGILATPYIVHPLGVAKSLWSEGNIRDVPTLLAALLHDTLEDTMATGEEIENHFGLQVRRIVEELTDNPYLSSEEKRQKQIEHAPHLSFNSKLVKLADRLYNIRDLKNLLPAERLKNTHYLYGGLKLLNALKGVNEPLERALEVEIQSQLSEDLSISR